MDEEQGAAGSLPWIVAAIGLPTVTGARLNEILTLRHADVDLSRGMLFLADSKTGRKTIYLNPPAIEVLRSIPTLQGNPYVICGGRQGKHLVNLEKP